jgi:hypothetical protein
MKYLQWLIFGAVIVDIIATIRAGARLRARNGDLTLAQEKRLLRRLKRTASQLEAVGGSVNSSHISNFKINKMPTEEQFQSAIQRIDDATTDIANDIRSLKDQIADQGLPADVEESILAKLESTAAQLEAIGASVENPVPDVSGNASDGGTNGGQG